MSSGAFGDDIESSVLHGVDCSGSETEILNCSTSLSLTCEHSAAVICQGMISYVQLRLCENAHMQMWLRRLRTVLTEN